MARAQIARIAPPPLDDSILLKLPPLPLEWCVATPCGRVLRGKIRGTSRVPFGGILSRRWEAEHRDLLTIIRDNQRVLLSNFSVLSSQCYAILIVWAFANFHGETVEIYLHSDRGTSFN